MLSEVCEPEIWLAILEDNLFVFFCPGLAVKTSFKCAEAISRVHEGGEDKRQQWGLRVRWERRGRNGDEDKNEDEQGKNHRYIPVAVTMYF